MSHFLVIEILWSHVTCWTWPQMFDQVKGQHNTRTWGHELPQWEGSSFRLQSSKRSEKKKWLHLSLSFQPHQGSWWQLCSVTIWAGLLNYVATRGLSLGLPLPVSSLDKIAGCVRKGKISTKPNMGLSKSWFTVATLDGICWKVKVCFLSSAECAVRQNNRNLVKSWSFLVFHYKNRNVLYIHCSLYVLKETEISWTLSSAAASGLSELLL